MKKEKMSLKKMESVLSHVLTREEMKEVMAGSGGSFCGGCVASFSYWFCYYSSGYCTCPASGARC